MRAIVDDKISVRFCSCMCICIHKPLRVLRQNLSRHSPELTLVFQITEHNNIVTVKTYSEQAFTSVKHVLYKIYYGHITVM